MLTHIKKYFQIIVLSIVSLLLLVTALPISSASAAEVSGTYHCIAGSGEVAKATVVDGHYNVSCVELPGGDQDYFQNGAGSDPGKAFTIKATCPGSETPTEKLNFSALSNVVGKEYSCTQGTPDIVIAGPSGTKNYTGTAATGGTGATTGDYGSSCNFGATNFLGLPVWYKYLGAYERDDDGGACSFDFDTTKDGATVQEAGPAVLIGLGIIDILLHLIGIVAVGFVIYGGIQYVISQGSPDQTKAARNTIINALVGAVIAITATAIVGFIGNKLG